MQNEELKSQYEYPTKFNKFKRIMEMRNNKSTISESDSQKKRAESTEISDVAMANATSNNVFNQLKISDNPLSTFSSSSCTSNIFTTSYSQKSTISSQPSTIHSPPKKLFINRSVDMQETPLNLTTKIEPMEQSSSKTPTKDVDEDNGDKTNQAMDTSLSENMIIEDHFKRSLGSLYNTTEASDVQPAFEYSQNIPTENTYNQRKQTEITPKKNQTHSASYINPEMANISPSVLINSFNFSLMTSLNPSPLDAVVAAAQLFNNKDNRSGLYNMGNNVFSNNNVFYNNTSSTNNSNHFFNSFPPPVYNSHHNKQPPSPHHLLPHQLSPNKTSSLHHSSSFHGFKSPSSSPSPYKSTRKQRYTPPDSYQPYPHHITASLSPSYDAESRKKMEGKKNESLKRSNTSPAPQASVSGSVDDHFSKSLGDVWKQVQANHHEGQKTNRSKICKQLQQGNIAENIDNNGINRLQNYISEFAPELEDLIPTSVDDHFAKALGDNWLKIQADKHPESQHSTLQQSKSSPHTSSSNYFRTSPKNTSPHHGGLIQSSRVKSPPSFYSSPSSFVVRS